MKVDVSVAVDVGGVGELDLLTDLGGELSELVGDGGAVGQGGGVGGVLGVGSSLIDGLGNLLGSGDELLVLGDEVGLGTDVHQGSTGSGDQAVAGLAVGTLGGLGSAGDAQNVNGLVEVAVGLRECLLGVHHAGAGGVAQLLDLSSSDSHG